MLWGAAASSCALQDNTGTYGAWQRCHPGADGIQRDHLMLSAIRGNGGPTSDGPASNRDGRGFNERCGTMARARLTLDAPSTPQAGTQS